MTYIRFVAVGLLATATATGCSKKEARPTTDPVDNVPNAQETAPPEGGAGAAAHGGVKAGPDEERSFEGDEEDGDNDDEDEDGF